MPGPVCRECGHANSDDARFCSSCGSPLSPADHTITIPRVDPLQESAGHEDDVVVSIGDLEPGTAVLVVRSQPQAGERFVLGELTRLGRHPSSEISLDDITVSRRHAEISRVGDSHLLADAGSLNGTYLNGVRIDGAVALRHGDEVQVGKFRLMFFVAS